MEWHESILGTRKGVSQKFLTASCNHNAVPFVNQHDQEQTFVFPMKRLHYRGGFVLPGSMCLRKPSRT
jgi:hypothetical protein